MKVCVCMEVHMCVYGGTYVCVLVSTFRCGTIIADTQRRYPEGNILSYLYTLCVNPSHSWASGNSCHVLSAVQECFLY